MYAPDTDPPLTDASFAVEAELNADPGHVREKFAKRWQDLIKEDPVVAHRMLRLAALRGCTNRAEEASYIDGILTGIQITRLAGVLEALEQHFALPDSPHSTAP